MKKTYLISLLAFMLLYNTSVLAGDNEVFAKAMQFLFAEMTKSKLLEPERVGEEKDKSELPKDAQVGIKIGPPWALFKKSQPTSPAYYLYVPLDDFYKCSNIQKNDPDQLLYENSQTLNRLRATIDHEAGHYKLGHLEKNPISPRALGAWMIFSSALGCYASYSAWFHNELKFAPISIATSIAPFFYLKYIERVREYEADDNIRNDIAVLEAQRNDHESLDKLIQQQNWYLKLRLSSSIGNLFSTHPTHASRAARFKERIAVLKQNDKRDFTPSMRKAAKFFGEDPSEVKRVSDVFEKRKDDAFQALQAFNNKYGFSSVLK